MTKKSRTHRRLRRNTSKWSWGRNREEQISNLDAFVTSNLNLEAEIAKINSDLDAMEAVEKIKKDYYPDDESQLFI